MAILNYSTGIPAQKTCSEIQAKLAKAGANAVMCEYDAAGTPSHVAFRLDSPQGTMTFRLPANIDGVYAALCKSKDVPKNKRTREQAAKVGWRIIKDWVEAQVAIIEAGMATMPEVFLPYAQTEGGETVYERIARGGFNALTYNPKQ